MLDTIELVKTLGYVGLTSLIFTETGLLIGLLLPGDSVLFSAGFLASMGYLHLLPLFLLTFCAAVLGDSVGYALGKKYGPKIFVKEKSLFLTNNTSSAHNGFTQSMEGRLSSSHASYRLSERLRLFWQALAQCDTKRSSHIILLADSCGLQVCSDWDIFWAKLFPMRINTYFLLLQESYSFHSSRQPFRSSNKKHGDSSTLSSLRKRFSIQFANCIFCNPLS